MMTLEVLLTEAWLNIISKSQECLNRREAAEMTVLKSILTENQQKPAY